jgi:hypothetical protein
VDVSAITDAAKGKIIADLSAMGYTDDDLEYEPISGYLLEDVDADYLGTNLFVAGKTIRASMDLNADHIMVPAKQCLGARLPGTAEMPAQNTAPALYCLDGCRIKKDEASR